MTVLDSGFHPVDSGFRVPDSGFHLSGFRRPKSAVFQFFFSVLMLFLAFRFRVRILPSIERRRLECMTSLLSFSIYKLREEMYYRSVRV